MIDNVTYKDKKTLDNVFLLWYSIQGKSSRGHRFSPSRLEVSR